MREKIDCFLPDFDREAMAGTEAQLKACQVVRDIFWTDGMTSSNAVMKIADLSHDRAGGPWAHGACCQ